MLRAKKIYEKAKEKQKKKDSHFSSKHTLVDNLLVSFFFLQFLFCHSSSLCLSFHRSFLLPFFFVSLAAPSTCPLYRCPFPSMRFSRSPSKESSLAYTHSFRPSSVPPCHFHSLTHLVSPFPCAKSLPKGHCRVQEDGLQRFDVGRFEELLRQHDSLKRPGTRRAPRPNTSTSSGTCSSNSPPEGIRSS